MLVLDPSSNTLVYLKSILFYGIRFNVQATEFNFDDYFINLVEIKSQMNCEIITVDERVGEYALALSNCISVQRNMFPDFHKTKSFSTRDITDDDISNIKKCAEFLGINFTEPKWRHCISVSNVIKIVEGHSEQVSDE